MVKTNTELIFEKIIYNRKAFKMTGIPIYNAVVLDEEDWGITAVALVDAPAVEVDFQYFAKQEPEKMKYEVQDEEKHIIFGCIARADHPMLRLTSEGIPYYINFSADTIRLMAQKYLRENRQNQIKLTHNDGTETQNVEMIECFIKNSDLGINPKGFEDVANGSLFGAFKVLDDNIWAQIKDGTFAGFSMEVNMAVEIPVDEDEQLYSEIDTLLQEIKEKIKK